MAQPQLNERLTSTDASFLYFERKEAPLHIGGIHVFDGEIPFEEFMAMISAKLPLLPRYRQIIVPAPFNVGHPTWQYDTNFNIAKHVFRVQMDAPASLDDLRHLAEHLQTAMLDRSKPLWEIYVISGLKNNTSALITKVHHAMVDGISGVDLMKIIFDMSPEPPPLPKLDDPMKHAVRPGAKNLMDELLNNAEETMKSWTEFQRGLVSLTENFLKEAPNLNSRSSQPNMLTSMRSMATPVNLMPFNKANSGTQKLGWSEFSFAEARAIRAAIGGTVNDVVLTVLSGAVAKYIELHGQKTEGRSLRVMVPVSMRKEDQRGALGNLVSVLPTEIPLDINNPVERIKRVSQKTSELKGAKVAEGISLLTALMGTVPAGVQALVGSLVNTAVPPFNIVCTNVPGPQIPLYVMGNRMTASYPYVPTSFGLGVSVGIMSYDQKLFFGVIADGQAMPDIEKFKQFLDDSFAELRSAAGVPELNPPAVVTPARKASSKTRTRKKEQAVAD